MKQSISYFDDHCDTISRCEQTGERLLQNSGQIDLMRGAQFAAYAQIFALFYDAHQTDGSLFPIASRQYERLKRELLPHGAGSPQRRESGENRRAARY